MAVDSKSCKSSRMVSVLDRLSVLVGLFISFAMACVDLTFRAVNETLARTSARKGSHRF